MRGDLWLATRLMLRPRGVIGLLTAVCGALAVTSLYLPWYVIRAEVSMLGSTRSSVVAALAGWQAHPWLWPIGVIGLATVAVGVAVAIDRPPGRAREIILGAAALLALLTGIGALFTPGSARFGASARIAELQSLADRVPDDVGLELVRSTASGVWVALASAALLVLTALIARDR